MLRCTVWNEKHAFSVGDVKTHQTLRNLLGEGKGKGKGGWKGMEKEKKMRRECKAREKENIRKIRRECKTREMKK